MVLQVRRTNSNSARRSQGTWLAAAMGGSQLQLEFGLFPNGHHQPQRHPLQRARFQSYRAAIARIAGPFVRAQVILPNIWHSKHLKRL